MSWRVTGMHVWDVPLSLYSTGSLFLMSSGCVVEPLVSLSTPLRCCAIDTLVNAARCRPQVLVLLPERVAHDGHICGLSLRQNSVV